MEIFVKQGECLKEILENVRECKETVVLRIAEGSYEIPESLVIDRDDITICGENEKVYLRGSKELSLEHAKQEGTLCVVDLKENGIMELGSFGEGPYVDFWKEYDIPKPHMNDCGPGLELFNEDRLMPISRYPKEGFLRIKEALGATGIYRNAALKEGRRGSEEGVFRSNDESIKKWKNVENILLVGYWNSDWATQRHSVKSIDHETGVIEVNPPYHCQGYRDVADYNGEVGGKFYALNVKEAISEPGEWCVDRKNGLLYVYPYEGQKSIRVSCAGNLFYAKGHKNITIEKLHLSECRKTAVYVEACENVKVCALDVKNTGAWGILGESCLKMCVEDCRVSETGGGGIGVNGGCRQKLEPADNIVTKCTVHDIARWHRTYMAAIDIFGVGCTVSENLIYDVPHFGIVFAGNNHLIEKNEINNACTESNDAGAIYSGRDWTFRGNVIRYNYLHDLPGFAGKGCVGLYFDDAMSSAEVYGNIFANMPYVGILLGGGRDFEIHHNIFYNCRLAIHYDKRAHVWESYKQPGHGRIGQHLREIDYRCELWKNAYPKLYTIEEGTITLPEGNSICDNQIIGGEGFRLQGEDIKYITVMERNTFRVDAATKLQKAAEEMDEWYFVTE